MSFWKYILECLTEAPSAFRRGTLLVTIIANAIIIGTVYLGRHYEAFTALQLATAAAALAALEMILIFPYRLWKANKTTIDDLNQKLTAVGQDRPFGFADAQFRTSINKRAKTIEIGVTVNFLNQGNQTLRWRLLSYSIEANGKKLSAPAATIEYFAMRGQRGFYNIPTLQGIPFKGWPVQVDFMFDCEYDCIPPLNRRRTKRVIRNVLPAQVATNIVTFDLFAEEA